MPGSATPVSPALTTSGVTRVTADAVVPAGTR